jgi:hypothetical protein
MSSARIEPEYPGVSHGLTAGRDPFHEGVDGARAEPVSVEGEESNRGVVTRNVTVEIAGSLTRLAANGTQATWSVDTNAHAVFQPCATDRGYSDVAGECDLKNAVLESMTVTEVKSTFPCSLGLHITGVNGTHVSREGTRYGMIVTGDTKWQGDRALVEVTDMTNNEYLRKYPGMTPDKISSAGIVPVPGENYVFVDLNHPIIEMLAVNASVLQVSMSEEDLIDHRWYKVEQQVVADCTKLLDQQLLQHLPLVDLTSFQVTAERLGQVAWDRVESVTDAVQGKGYDPLVERLMEKQNTIALQLKVCYRFM